ncbi:MAG: glycosyltransferase family 39 protein [Myxococcota bacterium]
MRIAALLIALCLSPAIFSLGDEVMEVDPAQYADVAARVARTGEWLRLEDMNGPFVNKPPLMIWTQAATMTVLGATSVAARLPALLFAVLAALGTFLLGRRLGGERQGLVAAALLGGSVAVHHMVADPKVDLALTAMTTLAIAAFLSGRVVTGWALSALAVLAKGPVGLGIVALALLPERLGRLPALPLDMGRHVIGALLLMALVAPFYVSLGGEHASYLLWTQAFGRILGTSDFKDTTTPLYFVHTGLWALLPMAPLLVASLWRGARRVRRERTLPSDVRRVPAWWFGLTFLVISASHYKLPQYVYWLAPPAALLAAEELLSLADAALARWRRAYTALAIAAAALGAVVLALAFPPTAATGLLLGLALLAPVSVAWLSRGRDAWVRTAVTAAASCAGFLVLYHAWLHPSLLEYQPWREVGAELRRLESDHALLVDVPPTFSLDFYAQRRLQPAGRAELEAEHPSRFVVSDAALAALQADGLPVASVLKLPVYRVSIPRGRFLRAATRDAQLSWVHVATWTAR